MKLIDESKIADGSNEAYLKLKHNAYFGNGFQSGVYFAENELQNLAIEFAEWILKEDYEKIHDNYWCKKFMSMTYSSKQIFDKFIEQRNKY